MKSNYHKLIKRCIGNTWSMSLDYSPEREDDVKINPSLTKEEIRELEKIADDICGGTCNQKN